jgi:hypothetical protein
MRLWNQLGHLHPQLLLPILATAGVPTTNQAELPLNPQIQAELPTNTPIEEAEVPPTVPMPHPTITI